MSENESHCHDNTNYHNSDDNSDDSGDVEHTGGGLALEEARPKVKKPPLYKVVLLNDDYTPMDFVVQVLKRFFGLTQDKATTVMLHVHTRGRGVAGVYT